MPRSIAQKLISMHLADGTMREGAPIALKIDQTLTQDATGTLVMLALEAIDPDRVTIVAGGLINWRRAQESHEANSSLSRHSA